MGDSPENKKQYFFSDFFLKVKKENGEILPKYFITILLPFLFRKSFLEDRHTESISTNQSGEITVRNNSNKSKNKQREPGTNVLEVSCYNTRLS